MDSGNSQLIQALVGLERSNFMAFIIRGLKLISNSKVGNKPLSAPPQKEEFKDYSHYSEHHTKIFGKVYYYKRKGEDQLYLVKPVLKKDIESKLKKTLKVNSEIMRSAGDCVLGFKGVQENLPNMSNLKNKELAFLTFESFDYDLHYEVTKRLLKNRVFTAEEVWSLLFVTIKGLAGFQDAQTYHGSVCLKTIVVSHLDFKMLDPWLMGVFVSAVFPYEDPKLLSDDLKPAIVVEDKTSYVQQIKRDVWFLGLAILQTCTLSMIDKPQLDLNDLNSALLNLKMEYTEEIYKIVREMLIVKPDKRPDAATLLKILMKKLEKHEQFDLAFKN